MAVLDAQDMCLEPNGRVRYFPHWLRPEQVSGLWRGLDDTLDWRELPIRLVGRWIPQPRLVDFHADPLVSYTYSGLCLQGRGWPPMLEALRAAVSEVAGVAFNSVLCNRYRDGRDSMGWHADNEAELGLNPSIASVSLGATRRFLLRPRQAPHRPKLEWLLESGSLLIMEGDLQHHWQHQLPKALRVRQPRINLTFRQILTPDQSPSAAPKTCSEA